MTKDTSTHTRADTTSPTLRRLNITVSRETHAAIANVMNQEQSSLTDATRRLLAYGDYLYRTAKDPQATILIRHHNGEEREIVLI